MYLAHTPSPPSAEGGGSSAERMVEEPLSLCGNALPNRKAIYRGSSLGKTPHKASPERGGARRRRAEGFVHRSPTPHVHGGSVSRRGLIPPFNGEHPYFSGGTKPEETTTPNASCSSGERGLGGEGKDSHSRQWRLSMAVFLNRNKRPQAAPIEVAELLSEKPPLPPESPPPYLFGREREGSGFS